MATPHANAWFSRNTQGDFLVWHAYCYLFLNNVADILEAVPVKSLTAVFHESHLQVKG